MTKNGKTWWVRRGIYDTLEHRKSRQFQAGMHWCSLCEQFKSLEEFSKNKSTKFGYNHWCKDCHNGSRRGDSRYKDRARMYNRQLKSYYKSLMGGECAKCGYNKSQSALEFHHVNPKEKNSSVVAVINSNKHDKIMFEMNKCILLCRNCHMEYESSCWEAEFVKSDNIGYEIKHGSVVEHSKEYWTKPGDKILYSQSNFLEEAK